MILRLFTAFVLFFLSFVTITHNGNAQTSKKKLKFKHVNENSLLSNLNVTAIYEDSKGFLWVGTYDGLNRFDGYDFKTYRNIDDDTTSLVKNEIRSIFEDSRGRLWVSTLNSGFHYYDYSNDSFHRLEEFSQKHCQVFAIKEGIDQKLWIGGVISFEPFIASLDPKTGKWDKYLLLPEIEIVTDLIQYSEDEFWIGTRFNGLYRWHKNSNTLENYRRDPNDPNSLLGNHVEKIVKDSNKNLWIGTLENGLSKLDFSDTTFVNFTTTSSVSETNLHSNAVKDLCLDGQYLWVATESGGGLSKIDVVTGAVINYTYDKDNPNSIINNAIWSLHKDKEGRMWIGSFAKGLCVLDSLDDKMQDLDHRLKNDLVNAILQDSKDRLWIGTEEGLVLKDKNGSFRFKYEETDDKSLGSDAVLSVYEDSQNQIWIGLWNGGLNRFDERSRDFIRYEYDPNREEGLSSAHIFSITESSKTGALVLATFNGLNILKDQERGVFEHSYRYPYERDRMQLTVFEDSKQNIWVGAFGGLGLYTIEDNTFKSINVLNDDSKVTDVVNCIFEDRDGTIWVGSNGGLHQMISLTNFITYTTQDGMPVNVVQGISEDSEGNLWLTTTKGVSLFDTRTKIFRNFNESDGLNANELRRNALFKNKEGYILLGGQGVNIVDPIHINTNPNKPAVYITDLKIFNKSVVPKAEDRILETNIMVTKEISLNHTHSSFSIHYVGVNLTASYKNQYAFKLEGFDSEWVNVDSQRFATYTNLDPGTYVFYVRASNNDGIWNPEGASLIINILPPWWNTWWAYTLMVVLLLIAMYVIVRVRTTYLISQKKLLKRLVEDRTVELKTKNEHIVMQTEELQAFNDSLNALNENLEKKVEERTYELTIRNDKLMNYAFFNAHNLRAPVANIKGILELFENKESLEEIFELIELLKGQSENLDKILIDIQRMLERDEVIKRS